jgi:hypothetical protein
MPAFRHPPTRSPSGRFPPRRRHAIIALLATLIAAIPLVALAADVTTGDTIVISEPVNGDVYAFGSDILINAPVSGDVIAAGARVQINAPIGGSVNVTAADVRIGSTVGGSVMAAASTVSISADVGHAIRVAASELEITQSAVTGDVVVATSQIRIDAESEVGGELLLRTTTALIDGRVAEGIRGRSNLLRIGSQIDGPIDVRVETLRFTHGAVITEPVAYTSDHEMLVDGGTFITADIQRLTPDHPTVGEVVANSLLFALFRFAWAFALGLLLLRTMPSVVIGVADTLRLAPGRSVGWGLLSLVATPLAAVVLAVTVVALPIALVVLALYVFALYASQIVVGYLIGRALLPGAWRSAMTPSTQRRTLALGLAVLAIVRSLPLSGWYGVVSFATAVIALGAVTIYFFRERPVAETPIA